MNYLGIEFGSTRVKAVIIDEAFKTVATGSYTWENKLLDGYWTYDLSDVLYSLQEAYRQAAEDYQTKKGEALTTLDGIGISGMMHGYLAFDANWQQLVPFRTWRNTTTGQAAAELSKLFAFNIPQRWSIAHYHQARLNNEPHVPQVAHLTTLAGWVHTMLSGGRNVLGVGEASGMFPIDSATGTYDAARIAQYQQETGVDLLKLLPSVVSAGEEAGTLSESGARLLDPLGTLKPGARMAPPEGDAGTGMVATNAVAVRTGNISAGTSVFAMVVLEKELKSAYPEIDMVTTPTGKPVAMVHCNNCTSDLNAWVSLFGGDYDALFRESLTGAKDCGGVVTVPYISGEPVAGLETGLPLVVRTPDAQFTRANFMRANIYSAFATLKLGMDILAREKCAIDSLTGHGGIFTSKGIAQQYLADALEAKVTCLETAGEGGPWGMAVLAAYAGFRATGGTAALEAFLNEKVFAGAAGTTLAPEADGVAGFKVYMERFEKALVAEKAICSKI